MRKMLIIPAVMLAAAFGAVAEERTLEHPGDGRIQYYKGYYWTQDEAGDSMIVYVMTDLVVYPAMRFKNEKERQEYNRLVRNVKVTLPYAKLIAETLVETYEYLETFPTQKARAEKIFAHSGAHPCKIDSARDASIVLQHPQSISRHISRLVLARLRQALRRKPQRHLPSRHRFRGLAHRAHRLPSRAGAPVKV